MHDVEDRREVGVLQFRQVHTTEPVNIGPFNFDSDAPVALVMLLASESGVEAESGVVFIADNGDEHIVVAGVYPYSLAVSGFASLPHSFEPEYQIDNTFGKIGSAERHRESPQQVSWHSIP